MQISGVSRTPETGTLRRLLSSTQAAMYLGVSPSTVRRLFYEGQIPVLRFGSKLRYDVRDLDAWITREKVRSE